MALSKNKAVMVHIGQDDNDGNTHNRDDEQREGDGRTTAIGSRGKMRFPLSTQALHT